MTQTTHSSELNRPLIRRTIVTDPPWLWLLLMVGSIAIHLLLASVVLPFAHRLLIQSQLIQPQDVAYTPIDLVELPHTKTLNSSIKPASTKPASTTAPVASSKSIDSESARSLAIAQSIPDEITFGQETFKENLAQPSEITRQSGLSVAAPSPVLGVSDATTGLAKAFPEKSATPSMPASSRLTPPIHHPSAQSPAPLPHLVPSPASNLTPDPISPGFASPLPQPAGAAPNRVINRRNPSSPSPFANAAPTSSATPTNGATPINQPVSDLDNDSSSPLITTVPIDTPVPDVSETLATPVTPLLVSPSPPQIAINADLVPASLTANLKVDPALPIEEREAVEAIAQPRDGIMAQNFSDLAHSVCLSLITPEAARFFGKVVAVQVATDVVGQVTGTTVRQSSQSHDYDALAQCVVQHWQFDPAMAKAQPVPSDALIVQVRVERN